MPTLKLAPIDLVATKTDTLVIGAVPDGKGGVKAAAGLSSLDKALGGRLNQVLRDLGATGKAGDVVRFTTFGATAAASVAAVGLGEGTPDAETLRRAAGNAVRAVAGTATIALALPAKSPELVRAVAEGATLAAYSYDDFRGSSKADRKAPVATVFVLVADPKDRETKAAIARTNAVVDAVHWVRDLVNMPPDALYPASLAELASARGKAAGLTVEVLDEKALKKGGFGGLLGVGAGSSNPPRLVRLGYTHPKATKTLALVGKGVTFDSGGLSIKPAQAMETMKCDMAGAAAVVASIAAIAALKVPVNVTAWMPSAENMPSGAAIRPSDVLRIYGGRTVEVLNTDAEGRLILADAIVRGSEEKPDVMVDVATLTGACIVALGTRTSGVMSNDDDLRASIVRLAGTHGESMWPLPLPEDLKASMESTVADISNMGDRMGGSLVAGLFLQSFVGEGIKWAHLDIAGPAYNDGQPFGYTPKGGTGAAVRTLVALAESMA